MTGFRKYGDSPFHVALVHGGPGGPGQMAPLARELSTSIGVLEPLQSAKSIAGQIEELHNQLGKNASPPVTLIGHSWGALLSLLFAAENPEPIEKMILVSTPPIEESYATGIMKTRFDRMTDREKAESKELFAALEGNGTLEYKNSIFAKLGKLASKCDSYDPIEVPDDILEYQYDVFNLVWTEAESMRKRGELNEIISRIACPVVALHGDFDPHPIEGVKDTLSRLIENFRLIRLENCGHYPWLERQARSEFHEIIKSEIPPQRS